MGADLDYGSPAENANNEAEDRDIGFLSEHSVAVVMDAEVTGQRFDESSAADTCGVEVRPIRRCSLCHIFSLLQFFMFFL